MFGFRKTKSAAALLLAGLILLTGLGSTGYAATDGEQQKYETVYAHLDHDGSVLKQSVVNRISYGELSRIEDYGAYNSVKALNLSLLPEVSGSRVIWDVGGRKPGVLLYEGATDRELPVQISISYFLDGRPVKGEELAGREGRVTIKIGLENRLKEVKTIKYKNARGETVSKDEEIYVPLMVQVTVPVDLKLFHRVESADDGMKVVSGETISVSFGAFPCPDEELTLELEGRDIELEPITLAVIPMMPTLPEMEIEEDLDELYSGVKDLNRAVTELEGMKGSLEDVDKLVDGTGELYRGGKELADNSGELLEGIWEYVEGADELAGGTGEISQGASRLAAGCAEFNDKASGLSEHARALAAGAGTMAGAGRELTSGLSILKDAAAFIERLLDHRILGPLLRQYGFSGFLELLEGIGEISDGIDRFQEGLDGLAEGAREFAEAIDEELLPGIGEIAEGTATLAAGAGELHEGAREFAAGGRKLYRGTAAYTEGVGELAAGLDELHEGILEMDREVGRLKNISLVDGEGQGLDDMEDSLREAIEDLRLGRSTADQMEILAAHYGSFMDNEHNKNSSVQFIMKTRAIEKKPPQSPPAGDRDKAKKSLWQKLKDLFTFRQPAG